MTPPPGPSSQHGAPTLPSATTGPAFAGTSLPEPQDGWVLRDVTGGTGTARVPVQNWSGPPERFDLVAHGELLVVPRRPGTWFSAAESRLPRDLAGQAALAAAACRSAVALQLARDRLVPAREEERRRLRRDLHDGVASPLVGPGCSPRSSAGRYPRMGTARQLLDTLAADVDVCTAEVRELIDGLRPAALDDGLEGGHSDIRSGPSGTTVELLLPLTS